MKRQIKDIKIGDKVKVYNVNDKEFGVSIVTDMYRGESDHYYLLNDSIKVTGEHPFYVRDKRNNRGFRWAKVKDLEPGDKLMKKNGKFSKVKSAIRHEEAMEIYNITVAGEHNYFAGGFLVHNKNYGYTRGDYLGSDEGPKTSRANLEAKSKLFNTEPVDSAVAALGPMIDEVNTYNTAVGDITGGLNGGDAIDPDAPSPGGAYAALLQSLQDAGNAEANTISDSEKDSRKTKLDTVMAQGQDYRAQTKELNAAKAATGLVTAGERLQLDQDVQNASVIGDAQQAAEDSVDAATAGADVVATQAREKAHFAFDTAKTDALNVMKDNMQTFVDGHTGTYNKARSEFNDEFKDSKARIKGNSRKNWSSYVRKSNKDKDSESDPSFSPAIPTGATVPSRTIGSGTINPGDNSDILDFSETMTTSAGLGKTLTFLKGANKEPAGAPDPNAVEADTTVTGDNTMDTIADIWAGSGDNSSAGVSQTMGPGQQTGVSYGGGNADDFVVKRCFSGDTMIEVI